MTTDTPSPAPADLDAVRAVFDAAEDVTPPRGQTGGRARNSAQGVSPAPVADRPGSEVCEAPPPADPALPPRTPRGGVGGEYAGPPAGGDDPVMAERVAQAAQLPLNDYGNGQRIVLHFGDDLMFVPRVGWHVWDGRRWAKDRDQLQVRRHAQALAPLILREVDQVPKSPQQRDALRLLAETRAEIARLEDLAPAARAEDHDDQLVRLVRRLKTLEHKLEGYFKAQGRVVTHAKNAGNNGPLKHMLTEAEPSLAVQLDDLDAAPLDVNVRNGVLRFSRVDASQEGGGITAAVELVPHDRAARMTKLVEADFDPGARCPRFTAFLEEMQPDPEVRRFLQRWLGLGMTNIQVQNLAFFYGHGRNGKSVLMETVFRLLSDYGASVKIESLTGENRRDGASPTPDLVPMIGARSVRTSEPEKGARLNEGLIKALTGGEPILIRDLHTSFVEITTRFKLTISGNYKPDIRGTDDGIWRRVLLVPWLVQVPPERVIDFEEFVALLLEERSGILNWLAEGVTMFLEEGLNPPEAVRAATSEYRAESDPLGRFLVDCTICDGDETRTTTTADLKAGFDHWLRENALPVWPGRSFALGIAKMAETWRHPASGWGFTKGPSSKQAHYRGIRWTDEFRARLEAAPSQGRGWTPDPDFER